MEKKWISELFFFLFCFPRSLKYCMKMPIHNSKDTKKLIRARFNASLCHWIKKRAKSFKLNKTDRILLLVSSNSSIGLLLHLPTKNDQGLYAAQLLIKRFTIHEGIEYEFIQFLNSLNYFSGSNQ